MTQSKTNRLSKNTKQAIREVLSYDGMNTCTPLGQRGRRTTGTWTVTTTLAKHMEDVVDPPSDTADPRERHRPTSCRNMLRS